MTSFQEDVQIVGQSDVPQLTVRGAPTQSEPLQVWEDDAGNDLAKLAADGRLQVGDDLGVGAPHALVEANANVDPHNDSILQGVQSRGVFQGGVQVIDEAHSWAFHKMTLQGSQGVQSIQSAVRGDILQQNSGVNTLAELRGGDFSATNETGTAANPVGKAVGVQGAVVNDPDAAEADLAIGAAVVGAIQNANGGHIGEAIMFEGHPVVNAGTIDTLIGVRIPDLTQATQNYALQTGQGVVQFGDQMELAELTPSGNAPANHVMLYANAGKVFARNSSGTDYDLTESVGAATDFSVLQSDDNGDLLTDGNGDVLLDVA